MHFQPPGYTTVAPWIVTASTAKLLEFIAGTFDGVETTRVHLTDGTVGHAEITVGDTAVLAFDARPGWPPLTALLRVWVADADAAIDRAVEHGGCVVSPADENAFGQRGGRIQDPFGNIWWISSQVENVAPDEAMRRLDDEVYQRAMSDAQTTLDAALGGAGTSVDVDRR